MKISHSNKLLKPLNQSEYNMIIIEDLGMQYAKESSKHKIRYAVFECTSCFVNTRAPTISTRKQMTKLCKSCSTSKAKTTHGLSNTILFSRWDSMKQRCHNPKNPNYKNYGAKGVSICEEWLNDFKAFYDWSILNGYEEYLEIDKDILCEKLGIYPAVYSPKTCKWITKIENSSHKPICNNNENYRGVFETPNGKYCAKIQIARKSITIGTYLTKIDGAIARDKYIDDNNLPHTKNFKTTTSYYNAP